MDIFLDTLDTNLIKKYYRLGIIRGITSNPTLQRRFNIKDDIKAIFSIRNVMPLGEIHTEATGSTANEIVKDAYRILDESGDKNLVFKIPFSVYGIEAVSELVSDGVKTSLHLIYSLNQAILAASVDSTYICPLFGRLDDIGHDAIKNVSSIEEGYHIQNSNTKIMASSIRHPSHVANAYIVGVDAITIPPNVMELMFQHPLTQRGIETFFEDYESLKPISSRKINTNLFVKPDTSLSDCLSLMVQEKAGAVIVVNKKKEVKGIFTSGDLKRIALQKIDVTDDIEKYMNKSPIMVNMNDTVSEGKNIIKEFDIEDLVVMNNDIAIGLLDVKDILI